jgi:hypothetical protein
MNEGMESRRRCILFVSPAGHAAANDAGRAPSGTPSRRLKLLAALLLGPLAFRPVALSQPAPGRGVLVPPGGALGAPGARFARPHSRRRIPLRSNDASRERPSMNGDDANLSKPRGTAISYFSRLEPTAEFRAAGNIGARAADQSARNGISAAADSSGASSGRK